MRLSIIILRHNHELFGVSYHGKKLENSRIPNVTMNLIIVVDANAFGLT